MEIADTDEISLSANGGIYLTGSGSPLTGYR